MLAQTETEGPITLWQAHGSCIFFSTLLCLCCGCLPLRYNTSPGASGVVLDSEHRTPLPGAQVVVSHLIYPPPSADEAFTNSRPPLVTTDAKGHFSLPAERRWDFFVIPIDVFNRFGLLVVKCEGYQTTTVPFWSKTVKDIGEITMPPGKKAKL